MTTPVRLTLAQKALIIHDGRLLALRKGPPSGSAGRWDLPGGRLEPGEALADSLAREVREETAATLGATQLLAASDFRLATPEGAPGQVVFLFYLAEIVSDPASVSLELQDPSDHHDAIEWVPLEGALGLDWLYSYQDLARGIIARLARESLFHDHHGRGHTHASGRLRHAHVLRQVCARPECAVYPTHNIHPLLEGVPDAALGASAGS